jgi:hypothetical protein
MGYDFASRNPNGGAAVDVIGLILGSLRAVLLPRATLVAENLALRQQLTVLHVSMKPRGSSRFATTFQLGRIGFEPVARGLSRRFA